jgi:hypothetical protein
MCDSDDETYDTDNLHDDVYTNTCILRTYCIIVCNIMLFLIMSYFSFAISCSFFIMSSLCVSLY